MRFSTVRSSAWASQPSGRHSSMAMARSMGGYSLLLSVLILTGCASQDVQQTGSEEAGGMAWEVHRKEVELLSQFKANGKMALRDSGRSESGSLFWIQQGELLYLSLSGPMGVNNITVQSDGKSLEVNQGGKDHRYDLENPEVIEQGTGWKLPLTALPHWLKGVPAPGEGSDQTVVRSGLLRELEQFGWSVRYETYGNFGPLKMPTKITIAQEDMQIRVILRDWALNTY